MFLLYFNQGERRYGKIHHLEPHPRKAWEFQVLVRGTCSLLYLENGKTREKRLQGPLLSVAGPDYVFGWGGRTSDVCQVIVFQLDEIDQTVRSLVGHDGCRSFGLEEKDLPAFQSLYIRCAEVRKVPGFAAMEARKMPGLIAPIVSHIVGLELTLICLRLLTPSELSPAPSFGESKVAEAIAWYDANLVHAPSIREVAEAVHVSPTHLRRLFHKVRGISPQTAFSQVQFDRAKWLMRDLVMPLARVAENSGFGSASTFSRSFKEAFGRSPKSYREAMQKNV